MSDNNDKMIAGLITAPQTVQKESKQHAALRYILESWEEAVYDGIEPEKLAHAALYAALCELVTTLGEDRTAEIVHNLKQRVANGEFTIYQTVQ